MTQVIEIADRIDRDAQGIECPQCHGYAGLVATTDAERVKYGCGRSYSCCDRAFICKLCGSRLVGTADAPEANW